ncbi:MAG: hypothetical protein IKN78_07720 [Bacteroidales bacterium]|nr:hypothetical protein [Bacteroidales bacterium]
MKRLWITLVVIVMGATSALFAQEKSPAVMVKERLNYMRTNLTLSGSENQNFWKVYEEYLNAELKAMDTYRKNLEKQGIKLGASGTNKEIIDKLNDKQLTYLQDQKFELRKNLLNLENSYYKKYKAILSPKTIQNFYNLEYRYKKTLTSKKKEVKKEDAGPVNTGKKKR